MRGILGLGWWDVGLGLVEQVLRGLLDVDQQVDVLVLHC